jgi:hypothetical protein
MAAADERFPRFSENERWRLRTYVAMCRAGGGVAVAAPVGRADRMSAVPAATMRFRSVIDFYIVLGDAGPPPLDRRLDSVPAQGIVAPKDRIMRADLQQMLRFPREIHLPMLLHVVENDHSLWSWSHIGGSHTPGHYAPACHPDVHHLPGAVGRRIVHQAASGPVPSDQLPRRVRSHRLPWCRSQ